MENNAIKKNYLEILPNKELIKKNNNLLPAIAIEKNSILPVIINKKEQSLIVIKKELENIKNRKIAKFIVMAIKFILKLVAKTIRFSFLTVSFITCFIGVSAVIVMSTAIITKNIVNSSCNAKPNQESSYSVFKMKDEERIRAKFEQQ